VAPSNRPVSIRPDQGFQPLDLSGNGRIRSACIVSVKDLIVAIDFGSKGLKEKWEGLTEKASTARLQRHCCLRRGCFHCPGRQGSGV
jgi:hypothetical protein